MTLPSWELFTLGEEQWRTKKQEKNKFKFKQNINDDCIEHIHVSVLKTMLDVTKNLTKRFNTKNRVWLFMFLIYQFL